MVSILMLQEIYMQYNWQCINIECDYKEYGQKGDKCPKCGRSFYKVNNVESKRIFEIKDKYKADPNSIREKNKRYNTVGAIIIGYFIAGSMAGLLRYLLNIPLSSELLAIFAIILGGFIATYISRTNKPRIGLYNGLLYSLGYLIGVIFILKTELTLYSVLILVLVFPITGLVGGYIAKVLRSRLDNEKMRKTSNKKTKNGYLICSKCNGHYELQEDESPGDFTDQCECGGKLEYREDI
jgi:hypothetical protein